MRYRMQEASILKRKYTKHEKQIGDDGNSMVYYLIFIEKSLFRDGDLR